MKIGCIGYNHIHGSDFCIDRTSQQSTWLFLLLKTDGLFHINGEDIRAQAGSFLLYREGTPQYYEACDKKYIDDWFHFEAEDKDIEFLEKLNIPVNKPTFIPYAEEISLIIRNMTYEFYSDNPYKDKLIDNYLSIVFYKLNRQLMQKSDSTTNITSSYYDKLSAIRNEIYNHPQNKWNVDELAKNVCVSRSTFQHMYKKIFGASTSTDIISARIYRAKYYLMTTDMTVAQISNLCGYNSEVFFMRQFKNVVGKTPTEFRRTI